MWLSPVDSPNSLISGTIELPQLEFLVDIDDGMLSRMYRCGRQIRISMLSGLGIIPMSKPEPGHGGYRPDRRE